MGEAVQSSAKAPLTNKEAQSQKAQNAVGLKVQRELLASSTNDTENVVQYQPNEQPDHSKHTNREENANVPTFGFPASKVAPTMNFTPLIEIGTGTAENPEHSKPLNSPEPHISAFSMESMARMPKSGALGSEANMSVDMSLFADGAKFPPLLSTANIIHRKEDEDGGLLGGIRRRMNSLVNGLHSGWGRLREMAQGAYENISVQIGGLAQGLGNIVSGAISSVQSGWSALNQLATQLTNGIKQQQFPF